MIDLNSHKRIPDLQMKLAERANLTTREAMEIICAHWNYIKADLNTKGVDFVIDMFQQHEEIVRDNCVAALVESLLKDLSESEEDEKDENYFDLRYPRRKPYSWEINPSSGTDMYGRPYVGRYRQSVRL